MYEQFSEDYDRFVNWEERLAAEMPFLLRQLTQVTGQGPTRLLDAACGSGRHAIALAQQGFQVAAADVSAGMIARARQNAALAGVAVTFEIAGFGQLAARFGRGEFDGLLCLGNSLPHLLNPAALLETLQDFAACLRPGGLLVTQMRNFDRVLAERQRWMPLQTYHRGEDERLYVRFYDFLPSGLIDFNILVLRREGASGWMQTALSTPLRPILYEELSHALAQSGFEGVVAYGDMRGEPFNPLQSGDLVVTARRRAA